MILIKDMQMPFSCDRCRLHEKRIKGAKRHTTKELKIGIPGSRATTNYFTMNTENCGFMIFLLSILFYAPSLCSLIA